MASVVWLFNSFLVVLGGLWLGYLVNDRANSLVKTVQAEVERFRTERLETRMKRLEGRMDILEARLDAGFNAAGAEGTAAEG